MNYVTIYNRWSRAYRKERMPVFMREESGAGGSAAAATAQCLLAALFLLTALPVCAQRLSMRCYSVSDGLAHGVVKAIHQDRKGYLWFGTFEGLSRFDGHSFTNYGMRDGLRHVIVNDIAEDRRGRLWFATNGGGVSRLIDDPQEAASLRQTRPAQGSRLRFISFRVGNSWNSNHVNAMLFDSADNLWLATDEGVYRAATPADDLQFKFVAPSGQADAGGVAFADRRGRLWFGVGNSLIRVVGDEVVKYGLEDDMGSQEIISVVEDRQGRLLAANDRAVFEFVEPPDGNVDVKGAGRWRRLPLVFGPEQLVRAMLSDSSGALWVGASSGLIKYRDGKQTLYTDVQGLSDNHIRSLMEDRDGNLWIGSHGGGVCKFSGELIISFTRTEGLPGRNVLKVVEDRQGRIYASVLNGGLVEIVDGRAVPVPGTEAPRFGVSIPLQDSRGNWWVSTLEGLFRFEGPELQLRRGRKLGRIDGIPQDKLNKYMIVSEDPFGKLWVMRLDTALFRLDLLAKGGRKGRAVFEPVPSNPALLNNAVISTMIDRSGTLWVGGHWLLARLKEGKVNFLQPMDGLPDINPRAFFQDSRGWLWIGLRYGGVSVTRDPTAETPQFVNYSTQTGLASDAVRGITEDDAGRIYLSTDKGLDRLDPVTGRVRHFNAKDGLASDSPGYSIKDRHGNIWIATTAGLSKLDPRGERIADRPLHIYFSRVQVAGEDLPLAETGAQSIPELDLPSSRNNLLIEYVALSFRGERRLRYQYKLEGVDGDWSQPTETRSVNYARLAPGTYRFLARAINEEGVMSPEPAQFRFQILPPLWQRWWFVSLSALGVGLTALAFYSSRIRRLVELERVRTRIATDLHDDIGSNLSQIIILSEVSRQRLGKEQGAVGESLVQIANTSRDLVDSMSDIVWAINPRRDRVSDLTQRMREFAGDFFTARGIEFSFRAPAGGLEVRLDADVRRQLYLIFKEAVNNAARHSRCTQAEVEFEVAQGRLLLRVRDNGRGFDPNGGDAISRNGNGLASMRERARALGGEIEIISGANLGTAVNLNLPLSPRAGSRWRKYLPV